MAGNLEIKNAQGKKVTLQNPDTNGSDIVVDLADNASKTYVTSVNKKRRNYLINGNFQFWDYATSQTTAGYGSDNRWKNSHAGSTKTHSRITSGDTERALFESPYYSRTVASSVVGANNFVTKSQVIEDITKLAGKTVTLSFWAKADSAKNIRVMFTNMFGTGGSPSATQHGTGAQLISLTSTWQKKTITVTIPSIVGKTLGTDGVHTSGLYLYMNFDGGTNTDTDYGISLGQQSGTFDIAEVKLEDGSVDTDGWSPYDGEWGSEAVAKNRYYEVGRYAAYATASGYATAGFCEFEVNKRITPSLVLWDGANIQNLDIKGFEFHKSVVMGNWTAGEYRASAEL